MPIIITHEKRYIFSGPFRFRNIHGIVFKIREEEKAGFYTAPARMKLSFEDDTYARESIFYPPAGGPQRFTVREKITVVKVEDTYREEGMALPEDFALYFLRNRTLPIHAGESLVLEGEYSLGE